MKFLNFAAIGLTCLMSTALASDGIATDGSMGAAQTLSGAHVTVPQSLGTTAGSNLYHSFSEFNIAPGQTVEFTGNDTLQNVMSRVTGSDVSNIEGTLKSGIAHAAFYFINPNGIVFGAGAQIDVPSAFHVSTADKIDFFNNGGVFYADLNQSSTLSAEAPAAFGFLGTTTANNGLITVNSSQLSAKAEQKLDLVAGNISVDSTADSRAHLSAPSGEIRLVAMQGEGSVTLAPNAEGALPLPTRIPSAANAGGITVSAPTKVSDSIATLDVTGDGGGRIAVWGGDTKLTQSSAWADNKGAQNATPSKGVEIRAYNLNVDGSTISSDALGAGKSGNITVETAADTHIVNGGFIKTTTRASGNAGDVTVTADSLTIDRQNASGITGVYSQASSKRSVDADPVNFGNAGTVTVKAKALDIVNGGVVLSSTLVPGDAGQVNVTADSLTINNSQNSSSLTGIASINIGKDSGNSGNVAVKAGTLDILNGGQVSSSTYGQGDAASVTVTTNALTIDNPDNSANKSTGILSEAQTGSIGNAGNVTIEAGTVKINNGGKVSSSTFAEGDAGNVSVNAESLKIDGQGNLSTSTGIVSQAEKGSTGQAGNVAIQTGTMAILNGGQVSSSTFAEGDKGSVSVTANALTINSQAFSAWGTGIFSQAGLGSVGNAGDLFVKAEALNILNGGIISSSTFSQGHAGNVNVSTGTLTIDNQNNALGSTGILSEATPNSTGQAGDVTVQAGNAITLLNGGKISIVNEGNAVDPSIIKSGAITVTALDIKMKDSSITTNSTANVKAGNVTINFSHWLNMDPSFISTTANTGNGGNITVNGGGVIFLQNSGFTTSVGGANSNGGDISVNADVLLMDTGIIQANAVGGSGGNILLSLKSLIPSNNALILGGVPVTWQAFTPGFNIIQAASQAGINGSVNVTAPQLNLSGIIANLGGPQFDTNILSQDYCGLGLGSSLTRKGAGGLIPKSADQLQF